jgi:mannose-6-phosphate isomerase-like protein (cupin superfamily)
MAYSPINLKEKCAQFSDHWSPRVVAEMNDYQFKLAKIQGAFVWHAHPETDEVFFVVEGSMAIEFRDGRVDLTAGEMFVVPKGVEHKPIAAGECSILLVEPRGVVNTGDAADAEGRRAENDVWV